jgi:hypothetical protein
LNDEELPAPRLVVPIVNAPLDMVGDVMVGVVSATLVWMFELETAPAVFGMAFNTELTKKLSTVSKLPAEAPVAKTTVVPLEAV